MSVSDCLPKLIPIEQMTKACIQCTQVPEISFDLLFLEQITNNCFVLEFQKQVPETYVGLKENSFLVKKSSCTCRTKGFIMGLQNYLPSCCKFALKFNISFLVTKITAIVHATPTKASSVWNHEHDRLSNFMPRPLSWTVQCQEIPSSLPEPFSPPPSHHAISIPKYNKSLMGPVRGEQVPSRSRHKAIMLGRVGIWQECVYCLYNILPQQWHRRGTIIFAEANHR